MLRIVYLAIVKIKKIKKIFEKNYPISRRSIPSITFRMVAQLAREFY